MGGQSQVEALFGNMKLKNPILKEYRVFKISVIPPSGKELLYFVNDVNQKTNHHKVVNVGAAEESVLVFNVEKSTHGFEFKGLNKIVDLSKIILIFIPK